jgi:hypothetical protein
MSEFDRILDAEKTISDIANELGRMQRAADVLSGAQDQVDAMLRASTAIVEKAGSFATEGARLLQELERMQLDTRLGEMNREAAENRAFMERHMQSLTETLNTLQERSGEILSAMKATEARNEEITSRQKLTLIAVGATGVLVLLVLMLQVIS